MENKNSSVEKEIEIKYKYLSMIEKGELVDPSALVYNKCCSNYKILIGIIL